MLKLDQGPEFLRLANALSALHPGGSEEKRLLDGMLLAVPRVSHAMAMNVGDDSTEDRRAAKKGLDPGDSRRARSAAGVVMPCWLCSMLCTFNLYITSQPRTSKGRKK